MIDGYGKNLEKTMSLIMAEKKEKLSGNAAKLDALSPLAVLGRGYSVIKSNDKIVKSVNDINVGQSVELTLTDGSAICEVKEKSEWKR